jgi:hypothetical protein
MVRYDPNAIISVRQTKERAGVGSLIVSRIPRLLAVAVHFGRLEDRSAPCMGSRGHQPSHIQRHLCEEIHPCYPTTIGVSGNLS